MAHYAFLNMQNIVTEVIAGKDETDGPTNWEIYIMNMDGSGQLNLTNDPRTDYSYVILPLKNL